MPTAGDEPARSTLAGAALAAPQRGLPALARRGKRLGEDYTKPELLGYLRRDLLVVDSQVAELERQMAHFAQAEGFAMGYTYVEKFDGWPAAFEALIDSVNRCEVTAVVLPSLLHFAMRDSPFQIRDAFQHATGARVMVLTP
ncbi:hypothetical protein OG555_18560 [Kribbella sp. NBC_01484]|uniref:hypothetical protein n=1 Tax=Kribbella sp. NBC_01484 TaxID=2903579 RepID=UPI002E374CB3|nr:hypothetical protein [Kribbella sp. NBC_01484]